MVDIDHFKSVNDLYGHDAGDRAIVVVASQVQLFGGISGRLGGEEFCLLLEHDLVDACTIAEELRHAIGTTRFKLGGGPIGVTASFGVAQWQQGETIDGLLRRADVALYEAKNTGRNCVVIAKLDAKTTPPEWRRVVRAHGARG